MGHKPNLYMSDTQGWLRILRISNSPTIVSNIMVGVALSLHAHHVQWSDRIHSPPLQLFKPLFFISIVLLLLYFAGMMLLSEIVRFTHSFRSEFRVDLLVFD